MTKWARHARPVALPSPRREWAGEPASLALPPQRVLVPLIVIGAGLCVVSLLVPGYLAPHSWARPIMVGGGVIALLMAVLVHRRGLGPLTLLIMVGWGDIATVALSRTLSTDGAATTALMMFVLPNVITALYGGRRMLTAQTATAVVGATLILARLGVVGSTMALQLGAFVFATACPAIAVLVLRERLEQAAAADRMRAITDPLTSVVNRRGLEESVPMLRRRARATGRPVGVVVLDIDHFKVVNDRYGHAMGDAVLQRVARTLTETSGPMDVVVRLGGEEFAVLTILPPIELAALGEQLRREVSRTGSALGVTASVGVAWDNAALDGAEPVERTWDLVDRADALMFAAKRDGRDQVRVEHT